MIPGLQAKNAMSISSSAAGDTILRHFNLAGELLQQPAYASGIQKL
jgi:hypothetical protein